MSIVFGNRDDDDWGPPPPDWVTSPPPTPEERAAQSAWIATLNAQMDAAMDGFARRCIRMMFSNDAEQEYRYCVDTDPGDISLGRCYWEWSDPGFASAPEDEGDSNDDDED